MTPQEALIKVIRAYERLIENPRDECLKWEKYGPFSTCLLCKACGYVENFERFKLQDCSKCPLKNKQAGLGCNDKTYHSFYSKIRFCIDYKNFIKPATYECLKEKAEKRLNFIKTTAQKNGFKISC